MQNTLAGMVRAVPRDMSPQVIETVRSVVARAVNRRMAGRSQDDREDVAQVAWLHALARVATDGADPRDAAAMSARECVRRWIDDAQANAPREITGGDATDLDTLTDGTALGVATLAPSPDHMTRADLRETYRAALQWLAREDGALYTALLQWEQSASAAERKGHAGTLKGMLATRVRETMPEIVSAVLFRFSAEGSTGKRSDWSVALETETETLPQVTGTYEAVRTVSGPACALRPALRVRSYARGVMPHEEQTAPMVPAQTAGTLALAFVPCGHASCAQVRETETVIPQSAGREVNLRDRRESGTASPVVTRTAQVGPACETCAHETCGTVRAGRYVPLTDSERAALGLTQNRTAYRATMADRAADGWAYTLAPMGAVRPANTRKSKRGGSVGTSVTVRGARHDWSVKRA